MELLKDIIYWSIVVVGFMAILAGLMYSFMWLIGQIVKMFGWWELVTKTMARIAKEKRSKYDDL